MAACTKHELRKIAETDDLHIAPFRDDRRDLRHAHLDLVGRGWRRSVRPRVQRNRIQLVSGRAAAKGGSRHSRRDDKGIGFRADKRLHQ